MDRGTMTERLVGQTRRDRLGQKEKIDRWTGTDRLERQRLGQTE